MVAKHLLQKRVELHGFGCGLAACQDSSIRVQKDEERPRGEELTALPQQTGQSFFNFPQLALGAASKAWRIEDKAIVQMAAANFACDKCRRVVNQPADGPVIKLRKRLIFACPLDGFARCIDVGHVCARSGASQRRKASVAKEGQHS